MKAMLNWLASTLLFDDDVTIKQLIARWIVALTAFAIVGILLTLVVLMFMVVPERSMYIFGTLGFLVLFGWAVGNT